MAGDFPVDIITGILCRLPVNILLRFKCVSKSWLSLISSPYFVDLHLQKSLKTGMHRAIYVQLFQSNPDIRVFRIDIDNEPTTATLQHCPLDSIYEASGISYDTDVHASCNGLLLLSNGKYDSVWNPSTRKHVILPFIGQMETHTDNLTFGFGYDGVRDFDYKVVRIEVFHAWENRVKRYYTDVKIFSFKNRYWKNCEHFPYSFEGFLGWINGNGVFVDNALHWIAGKVELPNEEVIISFDLGSEKFRELPLPRMESGVYVDNISVLGGKLVVCYKLLRRHENLWILESYGVEDGWVKLAVVSHQSIGLFRPVMYSKDGNEVLFEYDRENYVWFNFSSNQTRRAKFSGLSNILESFVCVESLVPVPVIHDGANESKKRKKTGQ